MYIKSLELENFRNYEKIKVSFSSKTNIFLGMNAQGKTNLLEGIYLNASGKSFKSVRDKEMIKFGAEYCKIKSVFVVDEEERENEIVIGRDGRKGINADGIKLRKSSEIIGRIYIVVFSPEDLKIVKEEPEKRRKFMNRELCQISRGYLSDINDYRRVLNQRNCYLKYENVEESILDIWDRQLSEYGSKIIDKRNRFVKKLDKISSDIYKKISEGRESIKIKYEPSIWFEENIKENYYSTIVNARREDIKNRNTGKGPHRDDIKISAEGVDLRKYGSQGQQRTAALSLKLSEVKIIEEEKNEKAVLLLDDVLAELDNKRQIALLNNLGENQMFITTTDMVGEVEKKMNVGKIFKISEGQVEIEI